MTRRCSFSFQPGASPAGPGEGSEPRQKSHSAEDRQTLGEEVARTPGAAEADGPISMFNLGEPIAAGNRCFAHKTSIRGGLDDFGAMDHFQLGRHGLAFMARKVLVSDLTFEPGWSAGWFILRNLAESADGIFSARHLIRRLWVESVVLA